VHGSRFYVLAPMISSKCPNIVQIVRVLSEFSR